jgi:hypothetical protein
MSIPLAHSRNRVPRQAWAAVERARLTVVPQGTQKAPRVPFVALLSLLLVGGVVGLLLFNTNMQQGSFVASALEEKAAVLAGKQESLQMQLDRLRDPQHIAARAKRLGMVPASSPAFIRLSDGKVLGEPSVATPTDAVRITPLPAAKPQSLRPKQVIAKLPHRSGHRDTAGARGATSPDPASTSRTKNTDGGTGAEQSGGRTP